MFQQRTPHLEPIIIDGVEIDEVYQAKQLGVWFRNDLSWQTHVDEMYKKGNKRVFYIIMMKRGGYSVN